MKQTTSSLDRLSARDREILRAEVADKIEALLPLTKMGMDWRPTFEQEVINWQAKANGCPVMSTGRSEYLGWAIAHEFVLAEVRS